MTISSYVHSSYFNKLQKPYDGGRTSKDFIAFMKDPQSDTAGQPPPPPSPAEEWEGVQGSLFVKHLDSKEFDHYLRQVEFFKYLLA